MKPMRAMRERVSELEWDLRVNLAACYAWWRSTA